MYSAPYQEEEEAGNLHVSTVIRIWRSSKNYERYIDDKAAVSLVHNIDAGLSVKTASKAPLYAGADAGIEISSIPASSV